MAATDFGALSAARKKLWSTRIWQQGRDQSFWMSNGFMGSNTSETGRPIHRVTELTRTERGDEAVMQLVADLQGDGVAGDNLLEGNEEAMWNDAITISIDQLRNGVRNKGRMAEQATVIRFRETAREKLAFWLSEKIDELMFLTASGVSYDTKLDGSTRSDSQLPSLKFAADVTAPTDGRILYAGGAGSTAALTDSDTMNWNLIVNAKAYASRKKLKMIRQGGKGHYVVVLSTEQMRDLKTDNTYQTLTAKAGQRGTNNPLFNNAIAVIDGVILYEHNKVFNTLGAASGSKWGAAGETDGAQALLMGAQAMGFANIQETQYEESDNTDYQNRPGISVGRQIGILKPAYKSTEDNNTRQDFSLLSIKTAAAATAS